MRMRNRIRNRNRRMRNRTRTRIRIRIRNRVRIRHRIRNSRHQGLMRIRNRRRRLEVRIAVDRENVTVHSTVTVLRRRGAVLRMCAIVTASDRNSLMVLGPLSHSGRILRTAQPTINGRRLTSWRISRLR